MTTPHDSPEHRCTWACPQADPLADVREFKADAEAGMTPEELERKHGFHDPADRAAVTRELGITHPLGGPEIMPITRLPFGRLW